jgi:hypothetical protein
MSECWLSGTKMFPFWIVYWLQLRIAEVRHRDLTKFSTIPNAIQWGMFSLNSLTSDLGLLKLSLAGKKTVIFIVSFMQTNKEIIHMTYSPSSWSLVLVVGGPSRLVTSPATTRIHITVRQIMGHLSIAKSKKQFFLEDWDLISKSLILPRIEHKP